MMLSFVWLSSLKTLTFDVNNENEIKDETYVSYVLTSIGGRITCRVAATVSRLSLGLRIGGAMTNDRQKFNYANAVGC